MLKGFREFIARGNVVDMAVAVVIGSAFGTVVTSLVSDLLTTLVAAFAGHPDFSAIAFTLNGSRFRIGSFLNAATSFVMMAAAVYFFVVLPMNTVRTKLRGMHAPDTPDAQRLAR